MRNEKWEMDIRLRRSPSRFCGVATKLAGILRLADVRYARDKYLKIPFFPSITLYYNIYYQKRKDHPAKKSAERQTGETVKSVNY